MTDHSAAPPTGEPDSLRDSFKAAFEAFCEYYDDYASEEICTTSAVHAWKEKVEPILYAALPDQQPTAAMVDKLVNAVKQAGGYTRLYEDYEQKLRKELLVALTTKRGQ